MQRRNFGDLRRLFYGRSALISHYCVGLDVIARSFAGVSRCPEFSVMFFLATEDLLSRLEIYEFAVLFSDFGILFAFIVRES